MKIISLPITKSLILIGLFILFSSTGFGQVLPLVENSNAITLKVSASTADQTTVTIKNINPVAYTVKLLVFNNAIDTETVGEKIISIGPNTELEVKVPSLAGKSYIKPIFVRGIWRMGDYSIAKDANGFLIPISNAKVQVCQSPDGPLTTHKPHPNAIDFCAPLGSMVVAAKDGIVTEVEDKYTEGGPDPKFRDKSNKISIYHADGSISTYGHLAPNSIKVQLGQIVKAGEQLGQVGMTGQTSGPHVHFMVVYRDDQFKEIFLLPTFISPENKPIPITYKASINAGGVIREAAKGSAANTAASSQNMPAMGAKGKCGNTSLDGVTRANDCYLTRNYPAAIEVLNQYINQNPSNGRAVAMLALAYSRSGQHSLALPLFQKAISMGRTTYDVYAVYAMSLDATGNIDEAIKMNQQALKIVPGLIDVTRNLYREYMSKGMKSEALALVEAFDANQLKVGRPQYFQNEIANAKQ